MWTTSSARSSGAAGIALACLASVAPLSCAAPPGAVASVPAALRTGAGRPPRPHRQQEPSIRLHSVAVHKPGQVHARTAGPRFQQLARDPLVIDVRVVGPIDPRPQDSAPVIILNGQLLSNTYARIEAPDQLLAFLPDRKLIMDQNQVSVVWAGKGDQTRSPQPLSFAAADISD